MLDKERSVPSPRWKYENCIIEIWPEQWLPICSSQRERDGGVKPLPGHWLCNNFTFIKN